MGRSGLREAPEESRKILESQGTSRSFSAQTQAPADLRQASRVHVSNAGMARKTRAFCAEVVRLDRQRRLEKSAGGVRGGETDSSETFGGFVQAMSDRKRNTENIPHALDVERLLLGALLAEAD